MSNGVIKKTAGPQLIPNLLQGIDNWRKGRDKTHTHIPLEISNNYYTQSIIGRPQELMVILYQNWSEVKHLYLQPLSAKVTYQRWISSLIKKLWDMAWDICNQHNHILHTPEGPVKNYRLEKINTRLRIYHARGISGLPIRFQLILHTNYHYLANASPIFQKFPMHDSSYNGTHLQGDKKRTSTYKP